jgi:hypothetical protein
MNLGAWEMYASAGEDGSTEPLRFFGPLGFSQQDATAKRVVQVLIYVVDDPAPDDYWAWFDYGADHPCHIAHSEKEMTRGFLIGQPDAPLPHQEQEAGNGRVVRLRIAILAEVRLRSGRRNWKVTSAL